MNFALSRRSASMKNRSPIIREGRECGGDAARGRNVNSEVLQLIKVDTKARNVEWNPTINKEQNRDKSWNAIIPTKRLMW